MVGSLHRRRLLIVVNTDRFFLSHRLAIARAAVEAGMEVWVSARDSGSVGEIRHLGFQVVDYPLSRDGLNLWHEGRGVWELRQLYRDLKPDLIHHLTPKPVIYGSLAARGLASAVVNGITGLGYAFTDDGERSGRRRLLREATSRLYSLALRHPRSRTIFENPDDLGFFLQHRMVPRSRTSIVPGSGVDSQLFAASPEPKTTRPVVMLASRLLRHKGVDEFIAATGRLKQDCRVVLVGDPDPGNPTSLSPEDLERLKAEGRIELWGHRSDMHTVLPQAHLVVLPSYREGLPKVLIEAASCARPLIATDVPGCREICRPGVSGLLVPPRDPQALAVAIDQLLKDRRQREQLGSGARRLVEQEFSDHHITRQTIAEFGRAMAC